MKKLYSFISIWIFLFTLFINSTIYAGPPILPDYNDIEAETITVSGQGCVLGDFGAGTCTPLAQLHINGGVGSLETGLAFGDGDTGFYERADDILNLNLNGAQYYQFATSSFSRGIGAGPNIKIATTPTATIASILASRSDGDTGIGSAGDDILSLITGGVNGLNVVEDAGAIKIGINIQTPNATHTINGSQSIKRTTSGAADYNPSILTSDYLITVDNSAAARAVTISSEDVATGTTALPRKFIIKDEQGAAGVYNITITLESGGNIDGSASLVLSGNYDSVTLYIDGTNAFIM